jgi:hypothetical protein
MPATKTKKPKVVRKVLDLDKVIVRREFQPREDGINPDHVADLRAVIRDGKKITPLPMVVLVKGEGPVLVRGHHQFEAVKQEGKQQWQFEVTEGTWNDAVIAAACSNSSPEHVRGPLRMTQADKRRAVSMILDTSPRMSGLEIVKRLGGLVSDQLVYDMKRERKIEAGEIPDDSAERLKVRDIKRRVRSNIGCDDGLNGDGHGRNCQVQTVFDWAAIRAKVGELTRMVQGVVASHPQEANGSHHQGARRLLDEFEALLFGDEKGQGGWSQKLNKKGE